MPDVPVASRENLSDQGPSSIRSEDFFFAKNDLDLKENMRALL